MKPSSSVEPQLYLWVDHVDTLVEFVDAPLQDATPADPANTPPPILSDVVDGVVEWLDAPLDPSQASAGTKPPLLVDTVDQILECDDC